MKWDPVGKADCRGNTLALGATRFQGLVSCSQLDGGQLGSDYFHWKSIPPGRPPLGRHQCSTGTHQGGGERTVLQTHVKQMNVLARIPAGSINKQHRELLACWWRRAAIKREAAHFSCFNCLYSSFPWSVFWPRACSRLIHALGWAAVGWSGLS